MYAHYLVAINQNQHENQQEREQRSNHKPYLNTHIWVNRDGRWQMLFGFNTRIE